MRQKSYKILSSVPFNSPGAMRPQYWHVKINNTTNTNETRRQFDQIIRKKKILHVYLHVDVFWINLLKINILLLFISLDRQTSVRTTLYSMVTGVQTKRVCNHPPWNMKPKSKLQIVMTGPSIKPEFNTASGRKLGGLWYLQYGLTYRQLLHK